MNMKQGLVVLQMVPAIISAVMAVESAIPMSDQGRAKLALVKTFISAACDFIEDIWPAIEKIIESFVALANATGIFEKAPEGK